MRACYVRTYVCYVCMYARMFLYDMLCNVCAYGTCVCMNIVYVKYICTNIQYMYVLGF